MREHLKTIWSTQELFLLGKIQMVRQSAGNHNIVGSSETTRETLRNNDSNSLKFNSSPAGRMMPPAGADFKYWFIGFTEGDGSFIVNKNGYFPRGDTRGASPPSLEFKVTQSSTDAQILFYIKKELGFGSVSVQDKKNKTHHFRAFNKAYNMDIKFIQNNKNPTLDNAWLSGFSDAEGCFTVNVIKRSETYNQVQVRYILSQKGELELMTKIAEMFNVINKDHFNEDGLNRVKNLMNKINKNTSGHNTPEA
ncbi:hypothetical protein INT45_008344 [Circinella minor]|uniref:Homing endonuclease LAGLIDADG domain-containing protein n=1 Tax=Circinella minor TaxID=1195481 RepID=A0A8H7RY44_9FUNG|nr:hypothetical protein INT45_008344 [Circinella minor]